MAQESLFYYFGDDEAYFKALNGEFKKHSKFSFRFERHFAAKEENIQALFLKIAEHKPRVVFIDFSKDTPDYLHLARIVARGQLSPMPVTVGLVDYLSPEEVLFESVATGIDLTHIKSAEVFDVVYDVSVQIAPESPPAHGFATAKLSETWQAGAVAKIGYVTKTGLHLETDFTLSKGDRILLDHYWTKDKIIPSREMFVGEVSKKNLFYHFEAASDLEFVVIDEFIPPEGMAPEDVEDRNKERDELIRRQKKKFASWVEDNLERSQAKLTKFLVIDRDFGFYRNQKRSDKYPYIIRCISHLEDVATDLERLGPQLISISLDGPEIKEPRNTFDLLEKLIAVLKRDHAEVAPYVVVFNTELSTKELRQQLNYENLMATDGALEAEVLVKMAELLDRKISRNRSQEGILYLKKTNPASNAFILLNVVVQKLSETDMVFACERDLPPGTNIRFTTPVNFFVNVRPIKSQGKIPEYQGLIHCIGESQKKELRRFINSVFFRDHDAQQQSEVDEFKNLNESKLKEKLDALKAKQEEALKTEETPSEETSGQKVSGEDS